MLGSVQKEHLTVDPAPLRVSGLFVLGILVEP